MLKDVKQYSLFLQLRVLVVQVKDQLLHEILFGHVRKLVLYFLQLGISLLVYLAICAFKPWVYIHIVTSGTGYNKIYHNIIK